MSIREEIARNRAVYARLTRDGDAGSTPAEDTAAPHFRMPGFPAGGGQVPLPAASAGFAARGTAEETGFAADRKDAGAPPLSLERAAGRTVIPSAGGDMGLTHAAAPGTAQGVKTGAADTAAQIGAEIGAEDVLDGLEEHRRREARRHSQLLEEEP